MIKYISFVFAIVFSSITLANSAFLNDLPKNFPPNIVYKTRGDAVIGNPDGQVTMLEFSDYQCPDCRKIDAEIAAFLQQHKNIKFVYMDYPKLGPRSVFAASAAIAAKQQGKYVAMHRALMTAKHPLTKQEVFKLAKSVGLNITILKKTMKSNAVSQTLINNMLLGNALRIVVVPTFIIGNSNKPHHTTKYSGEDVQQLASVVNSVSVG